MTEIKFVVEGQYKYFLEPIFCLIYWQNAEDFTIFQQIYGVGKVKLQTKWPGRLEIHTPSNLHLRFE